MPTETPQQLRIVIELACDAGVDPDGQAAIAAKAAMAALQEHAPQIRRAGYQAAPLLSLVDEVAKFSVDTSTARRWIVSGQIEVDFQPVLDPAARVTAGAIIEFFTETGEMRQSWRAGQTAPDPAAIGVSVYPDELRQISSATADIYNGVDAISDRCEARGLLVEGLRKIYSALDAVNLRDKSWH